MHCVICSTSIGTNIMDLKKKSTSELMDMMYDLIIQRSDGKISPGEYRSRVSNIVTEMASRTTTKKVRKKDINADAYDRAMRGI